MARSDALRLALPAALVLLLLSLQAAYLPALLDVVGRSRYDDFTLFYETTRPALDGGQLDSRPKTTGELNVNSPVFHLVFLPFAMLPHPLAAGVWAMTMAGCLGVSLWLIAGAGECGRRPERWLWTACVLLLFPGPYAVLVSGGIAFGLMLPMTLAWADAKGGRWTRAGAWLGVLFAFKLFAGLFLLYLAARRRWGAVAAALASSGGLALLAWLAFGWDAYRRWVDALTGVTWAAALGNGSLRGAAERAIGFGHLSAPDAWLAWLLSAAAVLLLSGWALSGPDEDIDRAFAVGLSAALLVSPLGWTHYLLLAAASFAALGRRVVRHAARSPMALILAMLAAAALVVPQPLVSEFAMNGPVRWLAASSSCVGLVLLWTVVAFGVPTREKGSR